MADRDTAGQAASNGPRISLREIELITLVSEHFAQNAFILGLPRRSDCLVVDPGLQGAELVASVEQSGRTPDAILITHGHADHIAGTGMVRQRWPECPILIGAQDAPMLSDPVLNLSAGFGMPVVSPAATRTLTGGEFITVAGFELEIRETPGHSPGHIVYVAHELEPTLVLGGDVLFERGIGRTDFPDGSFEQLEASIRNQLYTLPDDTVVLTGHGPPTTVGAEKSHNPFVRPAP